MINRPGVWKFNKRLNTLTIHVHGAYNYEIDLDTCTRSAKVLDWIAQIANKSWTTPEIIGDLVLAMDENLHLQANICPFGKDKSSS